MKIFNFESWTSVISTADLKILFIQVIIILGMAVITDLVQRRIIKKIKDKINTRNKKYVFLESFVDSVKGPASFIIYLIAITVSLGLINSYLDIALITKFKSLRGILILIALNFFLFVFVKAVKTGKLKEIDDGLVENGDKTVIQVSSNVVNVLSFIIVFLMILQEIGVSVSGLMAFGGMGGLIVGLSAKEFLSDFFGGIMLITDKPFKVGDWIRSPDRNIEGTVEDIGMRRVCVRTFEKRPLYIPNSVLSTITIENPSRMSNRRIKETIGIRYEDADKMGVITRKVREMLEGHSGIDTSAILMVNFDSFGDSSLNFFIYTFTKTTDWVNYQGIKHNILLNIYDIIKDEGADIAFPSSTIYINRDKNITEIAKEADHKSSFKKFAETEQNIAH